MAGVFDTPDEGGLEADPTVAHPDFSKPPVVLEALPWLVDIEAQPDLLGSAGCPSTSMPAGASAIGVKATETDELATGGLGILMPAAAAILRSSFSSRLRSFSLRLSTSSLGLIRMLACMSLNRAL